LTANSQTCTLASAGIHATAVLLFLFAPALIPHPPLDPGSPVLEIESDRIRLTDGTTIGGGNPDAHPPTQPPPKANSQLPPQPAEQLPVKPEVVTKPVEPVQKPSAPPKPRPTLATDTKKAEPPKAAKNAQDVDPALSTKPIVTTRKPIQVAQKPTRRTADDAAADQAAQKAAEQAERDRAAAAAARREQWEKAVRDRADTIRGVASTLGSSLSGKLSFEVPGKGGEAYAPYTSYLSAFYKLRWKKPATLSSDRGEVGAEIQILKDGTVKSFRITSPSGIRALDDSVRDVLDRNRQLRPLPDGSEDAERTITIRFDLSAASAM